MPAPDAGEALLRELLAKEPEARTSEDVDRLAEQARKLAFFRGLPPLIVKELCRDATRQHVAAGDALYLENEPADGIHVVFAGHVVQRCDGKRVSARLGKGAALGKADMESGAAHAETALAGNAGCDVLFVPRDHFNRTLHFFADASTSGDASGAGASEGAAKADGELVSTTLGSLPLWDSATARTILRTPPANRTDDDVGRLATCLRSVVRTLARAPDASLEVVSRWGRYETVRPGDAVFRVGDKGDRFYFLLSGSCTVTLEGAHAAAPARRGRRRSLLGSLSAAREESDTITNTITLRQGHSFGETAIFSGKPRNATVVADPAVKQSVELLAIDPHRFLTDVLESGQPMLGLSQRDTAHLRLLLLKDCSVRTEYDNATLAEILAREVPWIAAQGTFIRAELVRGLSYASYPAGSKVFAQGDLAKHFYVVLSGSRGPRCLRRATSRSTSTSSSAVRLAFLQRRTRASRACSHGSAHGRLLARWGLARDAWKGTRARRR